MALAATLVLGSMFGALSGAGCARETGNQDVGFTSAGLSDTSMASDGADTDGTACGDSSDCGLGQICQDGSCVPNLPGGPCDDDSNCVDDEVCENGACVPTDGSESDGMGCGGELYEATAIPPNVLIVLDRSGSMDGKLGKQGTKWEIAQAAIEQVVADYDDQVLFGLMLYPGLDPKCDDGKNCGPGAVVVDVGPSTGDAITSALGDADTCSFGTPTAETLEALSDYAGLEDLARPNFILLITDGQSTCDDPVPMVGALRNESPEIKTFVVGFGDGVDPSELDGMAEAGGTALAGDPMYYQADDAQALVDAFADIAGSVLSCSYLLDIVPPDPDKLYVYVNEAEVPRDTNHVNGWDYDPNTNQITFYGPTCELLQSGEVMDLQILFGCPDPE